MTINHRKVDMNYPVKESISLSIHIHKWIIINQIIPLEFQRILVSKRSNPLGSGNLKSTNSRLDPLEIIQIRSSVNLLGKSTTAFLFVSYTYLNVFVVPSSKKEKLILPLFTLPRMDFFQRLSNTALPFRISCSRDYLYVTCNTKISIYNTKYQLLLPYQNIRKGYCLRGWKLVEHPPWWHLSTFSLLHIHKYYVLEFITDMSVYTTDTCQYSFFLLQCYKHNTHTHTRK
jgi:hypothetical protein